MALIPSEIPGESSGIGWSLDTPEWCVATAILLRCSFALSAWLFQIPVTKFSRFAESRGRLIEMRQESAG
ncbi:MAG: hypothetical protein AB7K04_04330 [Pseudorhodoplanes sp.]